MDDTLKLIFTLLKEQKKKQTELADYLGIKPQTITDWKSGKNKSYFNYIKQISEFLNVSTDRLLGIELTIEHEKSTPDNAVRSAVIEKVNNLPDSSLDRLLGYLEALEEE